MQQAIERMIVQRESSLIIKLNYEIAVYKKIVTEYETASGVISEMAGGSASQKV